MDAVSTPNLESVARCLTDMVKNTQRLAREGKIDMDKPLLDAIKWMLLVM